MSVDQEPKLIYFHAGPFDEHQQSVIFNLYRFRGDILKLGEVVPYWAVAFYYLMSGRNVLLNKTPKDAAGKVVYTFICPNNALNLGRMEDLAIGLRDVGLKGYATYRPQPSEAFLAKVLTKVVKNPISRRRHHGALANNLVS